MAADFSIVLLRPEIPHNTGAIGRLCVGLGVPLHLVRPLGFALDDRYVARAGLDYWPHLDLMIHDTWEDYLASVKPRRVHFLSTHGEKSLYDCRFEAGDALVFGNESSGLPKDFYERYRELPRVAFPHSDAGRARAQHQPRQRRLDRGLRMLQAAEPIASPRRICRSCIADML